MRAFKTQLGTEEVKILVYENTQEVETFCRKEYKQVLGIDIETEKAHPINPLEGPQPGLDARMSKIRLLQIYDGELVHIFDMRNVGWAFPLGEFIHKHKFSAHYGMFERMHFYRLLKQEVDIACTMVLAQMVERATVPVFEPDEDDDKTSRGFGLAAVSKKWLGILPSKELQVSDWNASILSTEQLVYAALDAVLTYKLYNILHPRVVELGMERDWKVTKAAAKVVREMQWEGMRMDFAAHDELIKTWNTESARAKFILDKVMPGVNPNSSKQLGEWLETNVTRELLMVWPKTEKGAYSFSSKKLQDFRDADAINALCEYKGVATKISSFGEGLRQQVHPLTGRIHAQYNEANTASGRYSCSNPNLQNQPREKPFRKCFIPAEGNKLVISDFNAIEPRICAEVSGDANLVEAFRTGADLYKALASKALHKAVSEITDGERTVYKSAVLGLAYGMGPNKLKLYIFNASGLRISSDDAQKLWEDYHRKMLPGYSAWCGRQRQKCERLGYVETVLGRRRKLSEKDLYTCSINHVIQGSAAEVMKAAMVYCQHYLEGKGKIIGCIHDEMVLECDEKNSLECSKLLEKAMVDGFLYVFPKGMTTGLADAKVCNNWAEK